MTHHPNHRRRMEQLSVVSRTHQEKGTASVELLDAETHEHKALGIDSTLYQAMERALTQLEPLRAGGLA
jgi:hypothetical protein